MAESQHYQTLENDWMTCILGKFIVLKHYKSNSSASYYKAKTYKAIQEYKHEHYYEGGEHAVPKR